jgi:hypothetical protein
VNILFVVGSADLGTDGVGDYTRRIAAKLQAIGHQVVIVATHDRKATKASEEKQSCDEEHILTFRIPKSYGNKLRFKIIRKCISLYSLDWVSLQYVPHSFHPKGLPIYFIHKLLITVHSLNLHVMFHELRQGMELEASFYSRTLGYVQEKIFSKILKSDSFKLGHTQATPYLSTLENYTSKVKKLSLPSNISFSNETPCEREANIINFVFFGGISKDNCFSSLLNSIDQYSRRFSKGVTINFVGRNGSQKEFFIKQAAEIDNPLVATLDHGAGSVKFVSEILQRMDVGVTTFPITVVEKSGSVAAYQLHGIPTLSIAQNWTLRGPKEKVEIRGVINYKTDTFESDIRQLLNQEVVGVSIEGVVEQFVSDLLEET